MCKTFGAMAVILLLVLAGTNMVGAQQATFTIPEGWVTSPSNEKSRGEAGYRIRHEKTGLEMVHVPAGTFLMGSTEAEARDAVKAFGCQPGRVEAEQPAHEVELEAYWIGRTEVTAGQWRQVMGKMPPPDDRGYDRNNIGDNHPVTWITWNEALEFCTSVGLRLPTEAEWEYAARGPERRVFPWGNEWDEKKCCNGKNQCIVHTVGFKTYPAGSFPAGASWCGALDMAGNLWEWCNDWYHPGYYATSPRVNPQGPAEPTDSWNLKSARGGSYGSDGPNNFRASYRLSAPQDARHYGYGFRYALSAVGKGEQ